MSDAAAELGDAVQLVQRAFALNALRLEGEQAKSEGRTGALSRNVMQFARLLRRAGLPVGPAETIAAARALAAIDVADRRQMRAALRATMTRRREHETVFEEAFSLFWRDPEGARHAAAMALMDGTAEPVARKPNAAQRRVAEAMVPPTSRRPHESRDERTEIDAVLTASANERLQSLDFESMSADEITGAKAEIARLRLPLDLRRTRRYRTNRAGGAYDLGRTLRDSLRRGGDLTELARRRAVRRPPPLVVLCDISGSMARYAQILLHFLHAVTNDRDRVHVFLFGTRLTNISRQLRHRDPEVAFQTVAHIVPDWSGGTRIGEALTQFNRAWARRVLGQGAVVLLITDGLDRAGGAGLATEMDRLHRSARRLVWLNPLLRWDGFEPKSQGIRAMLPHVDEFRPVHNLASLRGLIAALSRPPERAPART